MLCWKKSNKLILNVTLRDINYYAEGGLAYQGNNFTPIFDMILTQCQPVREKIRFDFQYPCMVQGICIYHARGAVHEYAKRKRVAVEGNCHFPCIPNTKQGKSLFF
jgi:hypothetical protein